MARRLTNNTLPTLGEIAGSEVISVSDTTYTLLITDAYKTIKTTNSSAVTITVPTNASVAFDIGTVIFIEQWGTGQITISPTGGVTLNSEGSATKINARYASAFLRKDDTNTWILIGNITT